MPTIIVKTQCSQCGNHVDEIGRADVERQRNGDMTITVYVAPCQRCLDKAAQETRQGMMETH